MKKAQAEELMQLFLNLGDSINNIAGKIEGLDTEDERKLFRKGLAEIMGTLYTDLMKPVIHEYPELDPDKDKEKQYGNGMP